MNDSLKKFIGVLASVFLLSLAYYGSYLPLRKSQVFIDTFQSGFRSVNSIADFEKIVSVPLDMPSPIGQEELVRNASDIILNLVQQNKEPDMMGEVINYLEGYYGPIIDRGRGMSFEQNLYVLGAINELAFIKTKQTRFFEAAKKYYSAGLELGPKRPQFLYGMFDIYRIEGNLQGVTAIANQILTQWPNDSKTRSAFEDFLSKASPKSH